MRYKRNCTIIHTVIFRIRDALNLNVSLPSLTQSSPPTTTSALKETWWSIYDAKHGDHASRLRFVLIRGLSCFVELRQGSRSTS